MKNNYYSAIGSDFTVPRRYCCNATASCAFTPLEKEKLISKSEEARMNMSQYILALSEQKKIIVADGLPELCRQIIKIGTNVNQIALVANTNKSVSDKQLDIVNLNLIKIQELLGDLIDCIQNSKDNIKV